MRCIRQGKGRDPDRDQDRGQGRGRGQDRDNKALNPGSGSTEAPLASHTRLRLLTIPTDTHNGCRLTCENHMYTVPVLTFCRSKTEKKKKNKKKRFEMEERSSLPSFKHWFSASIASAAWNPVKTSRQRPAVSSNTYNTLSSNTYKLMQRDTHTHLYRPSVCNVCAPTKSDRESHNQEKRNRRRKQHFEDMKTTSLRRTVLFLQSSSG